MNLGIMCLSSVQPASTRQIETRAKLRKNVRNTYKLRRFFEVLTKKCSEHVIPFFILYTVIHRPDHRHFHHDLCIHTHSVEIVLLGMS